MNRKMMRLAFLMTPLLLAACADTQPAEQGPRNTAGWDGERATGILAEDPGDTEGSWSASPDGRAQFSAADGDPLFSIDCDLRGGLVFHRPGMVPRGNIALMQLRTGGVVRRLAVTRAEEEQPIIEARAPYNDQLVPALMRFQEPLEVRVEGLQTLSLPPSPVVQEFVQSCGRISGTPIVEGGMAPAGNAAAPAQNAAEPAQNGAEATQ